MTTGEREAEGEHARVAEERRAAIQLISDAALAHLEIDPLLTEMLARVRRIFSCDTATVLLLNAQRTHVEVRASAGIESQAWIDVAVPYGTGIAGNIVAEARPMVVDDVASADIVSRVLKTRLRSLAGVPLIVDNEPIGVLHIGTFQLRKFTHADVELLQMVAARAAMALDRAKAHEALRAKDEQLEAITENTSVLLTQCSRDLRYVFVNRACELFFGLSRDEIVGKSIPDVMGEDAFQRIRPQIERVLGGEIVEYESEIPYSGFGPRHMQVRYVPHLDKDRRVVGWFASVQDISDRKRAEQARESAIEELQQTLRYNEIFAGVLAHDLRNPLGAILTAAQLVLQRHGGEEDVTKHVTRIVSSGTRMTRMIDQLLDFTRARVGRGIDLEPRAADLREVCDQAVGELAIAYPEWNLKVESPGDLRGTWDHDRLLQVVSNLASNAGQHGTSGGAVLLKLDGTDADWVVLEVHNGGSIPEELLPTVFAPFRGRRNHHGRGLGLGLYITKDIVVGHGGSIGVTSSDADGTVFKIRLPRHARRRA